MGASHVRIHSDSGVSSFRGDESSARTVQIAVRHGSADSIDVVALLAQARNPARIASVVMATATLVPARLVEAQPRGDVMASESGLGTSDINAAHSPEATKEGAELAARPWLAAPP